jgi:hypothetical protein
MHVIPDALSRMYARAYRDRQTWGTLSNIQFPMCIKDMITEAQSNENITDAVTSEQKIKDSLVALKAPKEKPPHRFRLVEQQSSIKGVLHPHTNINISPSPEISTTTSSPSSSGNNVIHYEKLEQRYLNSNYINRHTQADTRIQLLKSSCAHSRSDNSPPEGLHELLP